MEKPYCMKKWITHKSAAYIANICAPRTPMICEMHSIITVDQNNNCKIVVKNCTPYYVILERDDILGILKIKPEEFIPLSDDIIASVWNEIHSRFSTIC